MQAVRCMCGHIRCKTRAVLGVNAMLRRAFRRQRPAYRLRAGCITPLKYSMNEHPFGAILMMIALAVLTQYQRVTDSQTERQNCRQTCRLLLLLLKVQRLKWHCHIKDVAGALYRIYAKRVERCNRGVHPPKSWRNLPLPFLPPPPSPFPSFPFLPFLPLPPSLPFPSLPFPSLRSRTPSNAVRGSGAEPQPKSNLVHFSLKIWHLVATILNIVP